MSTSKDTVLPPQNFRQALATRSVIGLVLRYLGVCSWHYLSFVLAALLVSLVCPLPGASQAAAEIKSMLLYTLLEGAALCIIGSKAALWGWRLTLVLFLVFHGTKVFMMLIEAAFFLNLWTSSPMISLAEIMVLEALGAVHALLLCPMVVLIFGKLTSQSHENAPRLLPKHWLKLFMKPIGYTALVYMLCYLLAGALILIPLAGDSFDHTYGDFKPPWWMPFFQLGRGVLWALLLLPLVHSIQSAKKTIGFVVATFSAAQLLQPNPYMLDTLRYAHFIEVWLSMFLFAVVAALLLRRR